MPKMSVKNNNSHFPILVGRKISRVKSRHGVFLVKTDMLCPAVSRRETGSKSHFCKPHLLMHVFSPRLTCPKVWVCFDPVGSQKQSLR